MKKQKTKQISFRTNLAFLSNTPIPPTGMWKEVHDWVHNMWNESWKRKNDGYVVVTFKVKLK